MGSLISPLISIICDLVPLYIINSLIYYNLFRKMGIDSNKGLIPIYRMFILYQNLGLSLVYFWGPIVSFFTFFVSCSYLLIEIFKDSASSSNGVAAMSTIIMLISMGVFLILSLIGSIKKAQKLTKAFAKTSGYTVGLVILENIFMLILALSSDKFDTTKLEQ